MRIGSILKENEMDRAQLILATKSVVDEMQTMAEKLAKMEAEGIMPLLDGIGLQFGPEFATKLNDDATAALRSALEALKSAKEKISANIANMMQLVTGEGPGNDMATGKGLDQQPDETTDIEAPDQSEAEPTPDDIDDEPVDNSDIEDVFGSDEATAGRAKKESAIQRNVNLLRESANPDRLLLSNVMLRMKNGSLVNDAISETAKAFSVDLSDVVAIISDFTSKKK